MNDLIETAVAVIALTVFVVGITYAVVCLYIMWKMRRADD